MPNQDQTSLAALHDELAPFAGQGAFVHFGTRPTCGVNPSYAVSTTPAGVYAYPVDHVIGTDDEPPYAASDSPFCVVVAPGKVARLGLLDAGAYDRMRFDQDFARLSELHGRAAQHALRDTMMRGGPREHPFRTLYGVTNWLARRTAGGRAGVDGDPACFAWADILGSLGYSGIVDRGHGMISYDIPAQAVFFRAEGLRTLASFDNPVAEAALERAPAPGM